MGKISEELIEEQDKIIDSNERKLLVVAGPGSGKTYTLINKAIKELESFVSARRNRGIILCSFTREASKQLRTRIDKDYLRFSFVNTLDAFVLSEIFKPYEHRIIQKLFNAQESEPVRVSLSHSSNKQVNEYLRRVNVFGDRTMHDYYESWKAKLLAGEYTVSFEAYIFAIEILEKVPEIVKYLSNKYASFYVDEAQDLNFFQIKFVETIVAKCDMNCFLIGDHRQSIYQFRGAMPKLFLEMERKGYTKFEITHSVRCHFSILNFARACVGENFVPFNDNHIYYIAEYQDLIDRAIASDHFFFLVETNKQANLVYEMFKEKQFKNIIKTAPLIIDSDKEFSDIYYELIEELITFYYNHSNIDPDFAYPVEDLTPIFDSYSSTFGARKDVIFLEPRKDEDPVSYLERIMDHCCDETIPSSVISELKNQLYEGSETVAFYIKKKNVNRIMTIHYSKGLESENVFILFNADYRSRINEAESNKIFVALTRAKNNVTYSFTIPGIDPREKYLSLTMSKIKVA